MFADLSPQSAGRHKPHHTPNLTYTHWAASNSEVKKQHFTQILAAPFLLWFTAPTLFVVLDELVTTCLRVCLINSGFMPHKGTSHLFFFFLQRQNSPGFLPAKTTLESYPDAKWLKDIFSQGPFLQLGIGIYNLVPTHIWDFAGFCASGDIA